MEDNFVRITRGLPRIGVVLSFVQLHARPIATSEVLTSGTVP